MLVPPNCSIPNILGVHSLLQWMEGLILWQHQLAACLLRIKQGLCFFGFVNHIGGQSFSIFKAIQSFNDLAYGSKR